MATLTEQTAGDTGHMAVIPSIIGMIMPMITMAMPLPGIFSLTVPKKPGEPLAVYFEKSRRIS
ncbi:hypothetical protein LJC63_08640 [Ruminococcaceae bacterium OttesenSCG-928-L11]|nr:hypothetical protein [Ruminococcaceae bacterium OttesenSCG-928-L11]